MLYLKNKKNRVFLFVAFFGFGLIVGSFLNAVLWRMKEGMTLGGRSMCPRCRAKIAWYDNIPMVSFLILGGKCRACREKISWRYPAIECSTGLLFALIGNEFFVWWDASSWVLTTLYLVSGAILILIFLHDLETMEIPNILLWIGVGSALPLLLVLDAIGFHSGVSPWSLSLHSGILAALVGFLPLFLLSALSRETWMGMGDGFLAFFLGLVVGWPHMLVALVLAFALGSVVGIFLILLKKKGMRSQVPLGPFLIVGAFLALFLPEWFPGIFDMFFLYW